MTRARVFCVMVAAFLLLCGACGTPARTRPRSDLPTARCATRLFERQHERSERLVTRVIVPAGTTELALRASCRADDTARLAITVARAGGGTVECSRTSGGGLVLLDAPDLSGGGARDVVVSTAPGVSWSVAVDAR